MESLPQAQGSKIHLHRRHLVQKGDLLFENQIEVAELALATIPFVPQSTLVPLQTPSSPL